VELDKPNCRGRACVYGMIDWDLDGDHAWHRDVRLCGGVCGAFLD
jgi:hypothetical protein